MNLPLCESGMWIGSRGLGDYARLHVGGKTYLIREPLTLLKACLDSKQFVRIHRSTIIQVERIVRVDRFVNRDAVLTVRDGTKLRVSLTYPSRSDELLYSFQQRFSTSAAA
jgi:two-component system LytT family response regulator